MANAKCLGVPKVVIDASNVGAGGTLFQWQALEKEEFRSATSQWGTDGLYQQGTLKHSYREDKLVLVPLGHWNWKWNQARGTYSSYKDPTYWNCTPLVRWFKWRLNQFYHVFE